MSRKHYQALAAAFRAIRPHTAPTEPADEHAARVRVYEAWKDSVRAIALVCAADNPRFDMARFLAAAGVL